MSDYEIINHELAQYDPQLAARPQIVLATKIDALDEPERLEKLRAHVEADGKPFFAVSAVAQTGVREVINSLERQLTALNEPPPV